ncbi:uncharacterized protein LOC135161676 isoform X2 [Diachasmimorpha longicaudata]|uniref:uncharacterized protein LOC135161676 isoform X2 n=1 Tax=Diachasmimorpha longicaudata TaxID=58733 RepID=UPI0030B8E9CB
MLATCFTDRNPSQLEKNSRRSSCSILKGPKARNPLESLETASSSTETTPSRLKRRVSFAEKKHVKEFCDFMEQGTVWDNTYEESDTSHMTRSQHDENHPPLTNPAHPPPLQSAPVPFAPSVLDDSNSSLIFEHPRTPVLELNFVGPHIINRHPELLLDKENIAINSIACLSEATNEMIPLSQRSQRIPPSSPKFTIYCDDENSPPARKPEKPSVNKSENRTLTLTDSRCLDFTDDEPEPAETIPSPLTQCNRRASDGMEITEALSSVLSGMEARNKTDNRAVLAPKSIWSILHDEEGSKALESSSVNMRGNERIPSIDNRVLESDNWKSSIFPRSEVEEKTQFLHDAVDITGHIPSVLSPPKTITDALNYDGMEMTEAIMPSYSPTGDNLDRSEMELTKAINRLQPISEPEERTQFFNQGGMEMTEAINRLQPISEPEERTQFFNQGGMEITEAINRLQPMSDPEERTQFFNQGGMEMTEAINRLQPMSEPEERTQFFNQGGMEMTEAINRLQPMSDPEERTQFFVQGGMEMTEAINRLQPIGEPEERTQFFNHRGMEMTEAINRLQPISEPEDRTRVFNHGDMEMTEAVNHLQPSDELEDRAQFFNPGDMVRMEAINRLSATEKPEDRTQYFNRGDMEITEVINHLPSVNPPEDSTQFFNQRDMEMTEAINCLPSTDEPEKRTQSLHRPPAQLGNSLMKLTETIPSLKRSYGSISTKDNGDSPTSSPRPKSSKDYASFPQEAPSMQDRKALHHLLHPDSPELSRPQLKNLSPKCTVAQSGMQSPRNYSEDLHRLQSETNCPQFLKHNHRKSSISSCHPISGEEPVEQSRNVFHSLPTEPDGKSFPPNLVNQSMELTCHVVPRKLDHLGASCQDNSMEITECCLPVSGRRTRLNDVNMPEEVTTQTPVVPYPSDFDGIDSSDSFKENRTPPGEHPKVHPVARPLFKMQDEDISDSTPTPLEVFEDFTDNIRLRSAIDGQNLGDVTLELTGAISKPLEDIEPPSFMFADSVSDENSLSKMGVYKSDEGESLRSQGPRRRAEEEVPCEDQAIGVEDQQLTCDLRAVPIPETEFTEEICNFEMRRRTRELQNNEENIAAKRRTYNIPEESRLQISTTLETEVSAVDRRRTHLISRHEERQEVTQRMEKSKTYVITDESSSKYVEVDGHVTVEVFNKNTVINYQSDMDEGEGQTYDTGEIKNDVLNKREWFRSDNYRVSIVDDEVNVEFDIRERETSSIPCTGRRDEAGEELDEGNKNRDEPILDKSDSSREQFTKEGVGIPEELSRRGQIVREHDALVKAMKNSRKVEEMIRQKMAKMQDKSVEPSPEILAHDSQMEHSKVALDAFETMKQSLQERASGDCLWIPRRISKDRVFVEFKKTGFTFGVTFIVPEDEGGMERIKNIYKLPRLAGTESSILKMTDRLIQDRINTDELKKQFRTYDDVLPLIEAVTEDIRFIYAFYNELKRMYRSNKMEITLERVSFLVMTKSGNTILEVSISIKSFNAITPEDIDVKCFLGTVRKSDIKNLIKNVKRNHKFITMYKNDVSDYIELMEAASMKNLGE